MVAEGESAWVQRRELPESRGSLDSGAGVWLHLEKEAAMGRGAMIAHGVGVELGKETDASVPQPLLHRGHVGAMQRRSVGGVEVGEAAAKASLEQKLGTTKGVRPCSTIRNDAGYPSAEGKKPRAKADGKRPRGSSISGLETEAEGSSEGCMAEGSSISGLVTEAEESSGGCMDEGEFDHWLGVGCQALPLEKRRGAP